MKQLKGLANMTAPPSCKWKDCNKKAFGLIHSPDKGYIPLCPEHYKQVRLKVKEVELDLKE